MSSGISGRRAGPPPPPSDACTAVEASRRAAWRCSPGVVCTPASASQPRCTCCSPGVVCTPASPPRCGASGGRPPLGPVPGRGPSGASMLAGTITCCHASASCSGSSRVRAAPLARSVASLLASGMNAGESPTGQAGERAEAPASAAAAARHPPAASAPPPTPRCTGVAKAASCMAAAAAAPPPPATAPAPLPQPGQPLCRAADAGELSVPASVLPDGPGPGLAESTSDPIPGVAQALQPLPGVRVACGCQPGACSDAAGVAAASSSTRAIACDPGAARVARGVTDTAVAGCAAAAAAAALGRGGVTAVLPGVIAMAWEATPGGSTAAGVIAMAWEVRPGGSTAAGVIAMGWEVRPGGSEPAGVIAMAREATPRGSTAACVATLQGVTLMKCDSRLRAPAVAAARNSAGDGVTALRAVPSMWHGTLLSPSPPLLPLPSWHAASARGGAAAQCAGMMSPGVMSPGVMSPGASTRLLDSGHGQAPAGVASPCVRISPRDAGACQEAAGGAGVPCRAAPALAACSPDSSDVPSPNVRIPNENPEQRLAALSASATDAGVGRPTVHTRLDAGVATPL
eukprot:365554-Chlamydomonas_euryale.AAC.31